MYLTRAISGIQFKDIVGNRGSATGLNQLDLKRGGFSNRQNIHLISSPSVPYLMI